MKVIIHQNAGLSENYAEIHCSEENAEITWAAGILSAVDRRLSGTAGGVEKQLAPADIFYFESVDKKTFAYLESSVWEVDISLREAEERFAGLGFVRINKSTVVNLYRIDAIQNDFEMRVIARLENNETLVINRHYKKSFRNRLEEIKEKLIGGTNEAD